MPTYNTVDWTGLSYVKYHHNGLDKTPALSGGAITLMLSNAALNVGDCVYITAADHVGKSTTAANYAGYMGVVVGGRATYMKPVHLKSTSVNPIAACTAAEHEVLIQFNGNAWVWAGGTITVGTNFTVVADTGTAGRVIAGATAGTIVGVAMTSSTAGATVKIHIINR